MIRVLGGPKRLCDGLTRRDLLHVGSLGMLGLGLSGAGLLPRARADASPTAGLPGFGQAKSCILLFMYGSPSQIETFDPKPDAPVEIRGELGCIPSSVPGLDVCELLAQTGPGDGQGHADPLGLAPLPDPRRRLRDDRHPGRSARDGAEPARPVALAVHRLGRRLRRRTRGRPDRRGRPEVPRNLVLPWAFSSQRVGEVPRAGPYGGFLGQAYDPICTEFVGQGTRKATKTLLADDVERPRALPRDHAREPVPARRRSRSSAPG